MKKIETSNSALLELLAENEIEMSAGASPAAFCKFSEKTPKNRGKNPTFSKNFCVLLVTD